MPVNDLPTWFDEHAVEGKIWLVKRLSANDTGLTGSHQAGPLIPRNLLFSIFPSLNDKSEAAPTAHLTVYADSHAQVYEDARAKWYWSKDEGRFTRVGGKTGPFLDPDNTGTIAVFVFDENEKEESRTCNVWVCEGNGTESDFIEEMLQTIEPRRFLVWRPGRLPLQGNLFSYEFSPSSCHLEPDNFPEEWKNHFPSGREIIEKVRELRPLVSLNVDLRLQKRRECEFELYRSVENFQFLPTIRSGFDSMDSFLSVAQSILQARKSRSGKSLEYHAKAIFEEEGLIDGRDFSFGETSELEKRPDFIFPSVFAYRDARFPTEKLRILACKTTCRDRWRQIISEADRVPVKHLLTLQDGVSDNQFREMTQAGIRLVVPRKLHTSFPHSVRPHLLTLEGFVADVRQINS